MLMLFFSVCFASAFFMGFTTRSAGVIVVRLNPLPDFTFRKGIGKRRGKIMPLKMIGQGDFH